MEVSAENDIYILSKYDKIQITETTLNKFPNNGGFVLQNWFNNADDKNNNGAIQNSIGSRKTSSSTADSGATNLPPIGNSFMYIERSGNNQGQNFFVSSERTDIIHITNIKIYYNRFSILICNSSKSMGCFRIQLLLEDNS